MVNLAAHSVENEKALFQAFVKDAEMSEDFGRSVFSVRDVHRIGILDLRIVNFDRNLSNMTLSLQWCYC